MSLQSLDVKLRDFKVAHPILFDLLAVAAATVLTGIIFLLLTVLPGRADEMPTKPEPVARVGTVDREFKAEAVLMGVAWTLDTVSTAQSFAAHPEFAERGYLFTGSRSTAKVMGAWAAVDVGTAVLAYEWKRHVRNRYLHPLWRGFMLQRAGAHSQAAASNWSH